MRNFYIITALFVATLTTSFNSFANDEIAEKEQVWQNDWQDAGIEDSVKTECRTHQSDIKQCRYKLITDVSVSALSSVILDVGRFKEWAISVTTSDPKVFEDDPNGIYVYTVYDFVGAYDRDAISVYEPHYDPQQKRVHIRFNTVDRNVKAEDLRLVRYPLMAGYWQFTDLGNGQTEIEHTNFTMPGGVVQSTLYHLYNAASYDASVETLHKVAKQAQKPEYTQTTLDAVLERISAASP